VPDRRERRASARLLRISIAIPISVVLVALSVVLMTVPTTTRGWVTGSTAGAAMFLAIVYTGAALNAQRRR
jgi:1,4-dihydroxy-2-naphthoate octaprenyltransferase